MADPEQVSAATLLDQLADLDLQQRREVADDAHSCESFVRGAVLAKADLLLQGDIQLLPGLLGGAHQDAFFAARPLQPVAHLTVSKGEHLFADR